MSMYLRTNCDRELFFSLFKGSERKDLISAQLPPPLSARPNIQLVTQAGLDFETHEMNMLISELGTANVLHKKKTSGQYDDVALAPALQACPTPAVIVQPALQVGPLRADLLLKDFNLSAGEEKLVPDMSDMRPDVIVVRQRGTLQWEVLPNGRRRALPAGDARRALSVVDVKNTLEGNKSYAAEVVLYTLVLARWLQNAGLTKQFFVSDECFIWTHGEKEAFDALPAGSATTAKVDALLAAFEKVHFSVIAPSVIKFFKEDIPRIVTAAGPNRDWSALDYHVCPTCSNCDWLGFERWLTKEDQALVKAEPDWYCKPLAESKQHLSSIPNLSRGARRILEEKQVTSLQHVAGMGKTHAALSLHSMLKRERSHLAERAKAILNNTHSVDAGAVLAGLARNVELEVCVAVNFDPAAGLLTGLACRSTLFMPFGSAAPAIRPIPGMASPVEKQDVKSEWDVVHAFLSTLAQAVTAASNNLNGKSPKTQIYFWEQRQFDELCAAIGRHIHQILGNKNVPRLIQALAWLFPPEELIERDSSVSPHIVFVGDIAQRVLRTPVPHAFTLLATAETYHLQWLQPHKVDLYFRDPLGNGIPRERIFEIWKNTGTIKRGAAIVTKAQASADYIKALNAQTVALATVTGQLRVDFKKSLKGSATQFSPTVLQGATGVAFDSKLWLQWSEVESSTARAARMAEFTLPAENLESSYKALVLPSRLKALSARRGLYTVNPDSREAKIDQEGQYFSIGSTTNPGLPLETPASLGLQPHPKYIKQNWAGNSVDTTRLPLYAMVRAQIHSLDRDNLRAEVSVLTKSKSFEDVIDDLIAQKLLPLAGGMFLMDSAPYDDTETTKRILKAIGSPNFATADAACVKAMGAKVATVPGTSAATPAAEVLWRADHLAAKTIRTPAAAKQLAARAKVLVAGYLDPSQEDAIENLSQNQLALVWGPPGTGKTSTLTAFLLAVVEEALAAGKAPKILLTGPNYRAVEVLTHKLLEAANTLPALKCSIFKVHSRSKTATPLSVQPQPHVTAKSVNLDTGTANFDLPAAFGSKEVAFFTISAHSIPALSRVLKQQANTLEPLFDLVVIDESSQVPVTLALRPLAVLKPNAHLVIAGDFKQMPPVQSLAPPVGAEHLVGSIHTYLMRRFNLPQQPLNVNYRSADHLVDFARTLGYDPKLSAHTPNLRLQLVASPAAVTLPAGLPQSSAWAAVLDPSIVVSALVHEDPSSSQANEREAKMVAALAFMLRQCASSTLSPKGAPTAFTDDDFIRIGLGVVTPHKAQRALVLSELQKLFPNVARDLLQESVDTVERFQGGERHTIIVSFGVGDVDVIQGEEEFLLQMERSNVAISRAMAKCIVLMPKTLAYHLPNDSDVAETAGAIKSYVEEFCANRASHKIGSNESIELRWR
jgi:hypothetical protein